MARYRLFEARLARNCHFIPEHKTDLLPKHSHCDYLELDESLGLLSFKVTQFVGSEIVTENFVSRG